jgi:nanoRNase/pAp phosphatase (c-di-AMP/oligoRNAs hydrolase)
MISETSRKCLDVLQEMIPQRSKGGRWLVLTHDNPDPDALASAFILSRVLTSRFKQRVTVAYGGLIGRAENREMVRLLNLKLSHVRNLSFKRYEHFALVDTQPRSGNNQLPPRVVPDIVIDHHPVRKNTESGPFYDVRPRYGATATILSEYLLASGMKFPHAVATAVVYAIRSETQEFAREYTGPDKVIYDHFYPQANHRILARIQNPRLPLTYYSNLHEALERLESADSLILSHLGVVEQPDIVPEIADLLLRMEGKTWSLVTGYFGERLYLSIRTTNTRADAGSVMRRLVGRLGKGGGHGRMAGGWVDASRVTTAAERRNLQRRLGLRLARELRKSPDKIAPIELARGRQESEKKPPEKKEPDTKGPES